jgi:molybdenum cofactor guanylyltransferase
MGPTREQITGLVLAGGRGSRMGGVDKGLQLHQGQPLALHALRRLQGQVGGMMINANRHLDTYAAMGVPVRPDAAAEFGEYPGPLAGWLAGLSHCDTPWLLTVPCDTPRFPTELAARLAQAVHAEGADVAIAATLEQGHVQVQPVFCLLRITLADSLRAYLAEGQRKIDRWTARQRCATVVFDDAGAFFNANTVAELQSLAGPSRA